MIILALIYIIIMIYARYKDKKDIEKVKKKTDFNQYIKNIEFI